MRSIFFLPHSAFRIGMMFREDWLSVRPVPAKRDGTDDAANYLKKRASSNFRSLRPG